MNQQDKGDFERFEMDGAAGESEQGDIRVDLTAA